MNRFKYSFALLSVALCIGMASAAEDTAEALPGRPLRLALDLVDGSRVIGVPTVESVSLRTSYAQLDIPLAQLSRIEVAGDHESASIELRNGDRLSGAVALGDVQLETSFGPVSVGSEHVMSIVALPGQASGGLVLHYDFDGDDGGQVVDRSGNENHGRVVGPITYVDGIAGRGIRITTPDAYVESSAPGLNMEGWREVTVSVWFKLERQTTYGTILTRSATDGKRGAALGLVLGGASSCEGAFSCSGAGVKSSAFSKGRPPPLGEWQHVVATVGPRTARLYVNGSLDAENVRKALGEPIHDSPDYAFTVGKHRAHRESWRDAYTHGVIDEVKVWRRALSEPEIKRMHEMRR